MTTDSRTSTYLRMECEQRLYPAFDSFHATPSPMLWRRVSIWTAKGDASFEQTDYGHPGRLNDWEPRGVSSALLPQLAELKALAASAGALL